MTDQRDLKRRVRERMAKTGESYTAARKHILDRGTDEPRAVDAPAPAMEVVEPVDLTESAAQLGFKCRVKMFPALAARISTVGALRQLRDALLATEGDPSTQQLRASVLRGEVPPRQTWRMGESHDDLVRFVRRAMAGLGGVSPKGTMLALHVESEIVLCILTSHRASGSTEAWPLLWIHSVKESLGTLKVAGLLRR
jgi:hypothetical protein